MTISDYSANLQALKINVQVETKLNQTIPIVDKNSDIAKQQANGIDDVNTLIPSVLLNNELDYSKEDQLKKSLIENILAGFGLNASQAKLIPNDALVFNYESSSSNPYQQTLTQSQNGLVYTSTEEFYEKTNIEFSGQIEIQTPEGTFNLDINFSYTREFYEKNTQEIAYLEDSVKVPFVLDSNEYNDSFKKFSALHLRFDVLQEETQKNNKSIFEYLEEIIAKNDKKNEYQDKSVDNFEIWQKEVGMEYSMVAAQNDGIGIFMESSKINSSSFSLKANENGYSMQSSSSSFEMTSQKTVYSYA